MRIYTGNVLDILPTLPSNSVQCCVTSPPYWNLRDYGTASWEGGNPACDHTQLPTIGASTLRNDGREHVGTQIGDKAALIGKPFRATCGKCGARRVDAQLGMEATPQEYVANMVRVFEEVRRVLRDDGTLWLNLGDSYANSGGIGVMYGSSYNTNGVVQVRPARAEGLKPKDLCGIPWRVAFALQDAGWWLRSDIIWAKPNPMPESVTDRPTKAHEYIFLLTKSAKYFYDAEAVKEASADPEGSAARYELPFYNGAKEVAGGGRPNGARNTEGMKMFTGTRNRRSVWTITTKGYDGAHFATFPPELPEICIMAGTSAKGACPTCGAPWERVVERSGGTIGKVWTDHTQDLVRGMSQVGINVGNAKDANSKPYTVETTGWQPTCACGHTDTVPCVVLDPFTGSGTTGAVAVNLGRDFVGCELNPEYVKLAEKRIGHSQPAMFGIGV